MRKKRDGAHHRDGWPLFIHVHTIWMKNIRRERKREDIVPVGYIQIYSYIRCNISGSHQTCTAVLLLAYRWIYNIYTAWTPHRAVFLIYSSFFPIHIFIFPLCFLYFLLPIYRGENNRRKKKHLLTGKHIAYLFICKFIFLIITRIW